MNGRSVAFEIPGGIGGKGRARAFIRRGKINHYTPPQTHADEAVVRHFANEAMIKAGVRELTGPLKMEVQINKRFPKSWSNKRKAATTYVTGKPDCDNILKLICDAMNGVAYHDDSQIAVVVFQRTYGLPEFVGVELKELAVIP